MSGLIAKDFALLLQRKRSFIIIIVCGLIMGISANPTFVVGWMSFIGAMFSISTIAYDEHDNCLPFLMTLPVSRKSYAVEKYVFGIMNAIIFWLCGLVLWAVGCIINKTGFNAAEDITQLLLVFFPSLLIIDFTIPFNLKYGSEKARVYMFIFLGIITAVCFLLFRYAKCDFTAEIPFNSLPSALPAMAFAVSVILTAISMVISIRVMTKKEF